MNPGSVGLTWEAIAGRGGVIAAIPFLPAGKGALILILGGLAMLTVCVLFARFHAGPQAAHDQSGQARMASPPPRRNARPQGATVRRVAPTAPLPPSPATPGVVPRWVAGLERAAAVMHLGAGRIVSADDDRCLFLLSGCGSCRMGRKGGHGCDRERKAIGRALRSQAPRVHVSEASCNASGAGACSFEIRRLGYF
ncbi:MAG: hypothetical protein V4510_06265 [bacterium]